MTRHKPLLLPALALAFAAAGAAPAGATTFCVPDYSAACSNDGTNIPVPSLETASKLGNSDGIADRIVIAPGTLTDSNGFMVGAGTDPLEIVGAGQDATVLTTDSKLSDKQVVDLIGAGRLVTLRDLTVVVPATVAADGVGVVLEGDTLDRVEIEGHGLNPTGVTAFHGGTIRDSHIHSTSKESSGVSASTDGSVAIERSHIRAGAVGVSTGGPVAVDVRGSHIDVADGAGLYAYGGGDIDLTNSIVTNGAGSGAYALCRTDTSSSIAVTHSTMISRDEAGNSPALVAKVNPQETASCSVTVASSIVRGYEKPYERKAPVGATWGDAHITVAHSDMPLTGGASVGDGTLDVATGNIDADPLFAGADDFRLTAGSPAIDHGFAGDLGIATDFAGGAREVDGDGDGVVRRDMGAYEFVPAAEAGDAPAAGEPAGQPSGPANSTPPQDSPPVRDRTAPRISRVRLKGRRLSLRLSEAATLRVTVRGKRRTFKGKAGVNVLRLKRGTKRVTVVATDAAGNRSKAARVKQR